MPGVEAETFKAEAATSTVEVLNPSALADKPAG